MTNVNEYQFEEIAKLCEIARLCEVYKITAGDGDIDSCLSDYESLYKVWCKGMNRGIYRYEAEEGYCIEFVERVLYEATQKGYSSVQGVIEHIALGDLVGDIFHNEIVKQELVRMLTVPADFEDRHVSVDINLLKDALIKMNRLLIQEGEEVTIDGNMWEEAQNSLFIILDELQLTVSNESDFDTHEFVIVNKF
mgnify:CR=1 FL=1